MEDYDVPQLKPQTSNLKPQTSAPAYVYLLRCADGTYYTGWTVDLVRRVAAHNRGTGARYTRSRRPVTLAYYEPLPDRTTARRREYQMRRLSHAAKQALSQGMPPAPEGHDFTHLLQEDDSA